MRGLGLMLLLWLALAPQAQARTCLVLSGGGARGIAHVGVIKVLERERVAVDCVVGTSMGAVIGSLLASGLDAGEIEAAVEAVDWSGVFTDASARVDRPLRSRQQDRTFLVGAAIGYRHGRFALPRALVQGQRLGLVLRGFLLPTAGIDDFDALPTPFRAVGTDLETGATVVMARGDLATAVRASMAVPGVFPPVEWEEHLVVDGGSASNLPVAVARAMGATRVIAVDISAPLRSRDRLTSPLVITDQMLTALIRRQTDAEIASLGPDDLLITPELGDLGSSDFVRAAQEAIAPGQVAAEVERAKLAAFALRPDDYAAWRDRRRAALRPLGAVSRVTLAQAPAATEAVLRAYLSEYPGERFDRATLEHDIARLYGRGEFERVDYALLPGTDGDELRVTVRDKAWGEGSLRFGLRLEDDFDGSSNFDLGARLRATEVNDHGAEWQADVQIGKTTRVGYEWLHPLDAERRYWLLPRAAYSARNLPIFLGDSRAVELRRQTLEAGIDFGRWLGDWGSVGLGLMRRTSRYEERTSTIGIPDTQEASTALRLDFLLDTQDDAQFPRRGTYLQASARHYLQALGGGFDATVYALRGSRALPVAQDDRLLLQGRLQYIDGRESPADEEAFLGGFLDLSGYSEDARFGRHLALGQIIYYRQLTRVFDRFRVFAGGSLEIGNTWEAGADIDLDSLLLGGSVFVASESPLGALYLGYGQAERGENSLYLYIGRPY